MNSDSSAASSSSDEDSSSSVSSSNVLVIQPPTYDKVLLENHLKSANKHPNLYPEHLIVSIDYLLDHPISPPPDPLRTYLRLNRKHFPEGNGIYTGEIDPKSRRHGFGQMAYFGGDCYCGHWRKGVREGSGAYFWSETGSVYAGEWKSGERDGQGHFVFGSGRNLVSSGVVLTGMWKKGKVKGWGNLAFVDEDGVNVVKQRIQIEEDVEVKSKLGRRISWKSFLNSNL